MFDAETYAESVWQNILNEESKTRKMRGRT